jgi:hypothetical protein
MKWGESGESRVCGKVQVQWEKSYLKKNNAAESLRTKICPLLDN